MKWFRRLLLSCVWMQSVRSRINDGGASARPPPQQQHSPNDGYANRFRQAQQEPVFTADEDEVVGVIVRVKNSAGADSLSRMADEVDGTKLNQIDRLVARIKRSEIAALEEDPDIDAVEADGFYYPDSEAILYGLEMVQALSPVIPKISDDVPASCSSAESFKIGIIDSGLAVDHPDVPCFNVGEADSNCIGAEFGVREGDGLWWNPQNAYHGTHVFGSIGASGENNEGVQGVIPDGNVCYVIGRVFGETPGGSSMSDVFEAVGWMVEQGVHVINMSLGGSTQSQAGADAMEAAYAAGTLLFAAAGNDGSRSEHFPASYPHVISVAAVDEDEEQAVFSQYNSGVDIAGPGVGILSTFPLEAGSAVLLNSPNVGTPGVAMRFSAELTGTLSGELVECGLGESTCPTGSTSNHICLIERGGGIKFEQKTLSCELSGGIAAVIYNNVKGIINGGLAEPTETSIPSLAITQSAGESLVAESLGETMTITEQPGYNYLSGTSMASPYVAGVAGKVWRACPSCTNSQVENCLYSSAIDLGETGRDIVFGSGLVQAEDAYLCLRDEIGCCDESVVNADAVPPPSVPVAPPAPAPVAAPIPSNPANQSEVLSAADMITTMYWFEYNVYSFLTGAMDSANFTENLLTVVTSDVIFESSYDPSDASLQPLFESRQGADDLLARYEYRRDFVTDSSYSNPGDIGTGPADGVLYYHRSHVGSFGGGAEVSWETSCKLTFDVAARKISEILLTVIDPEPIELAYPAEL